MMTMIRFEIKKIMRRRLIPILLAVFLLLNGLLDYWQIIRPSEQNIFTQKELASVYGLLEDVPETKRQEKILEIITGRPLENPEDFSFLSAASSVYGHIRQNAGYEDYLKMVETQADDFLSSPLIPETSFTYQNAKKTKEIYGRITGVQPVSENPGGVMLAVQNAYSDAIFYAAVFLVVFTLCIEDRQNDFSELIKTKKRGRIPYIFAKFSVLFLFSLLFGLAIFCEDTAIAAGYLGLGDVSRPIQSLPAYFETPYMLTVKDLLIEEVFQKFYSGFCFGCVLLCIFQLIKSPVLAIFAAATLFGGEYLLTERIGVNGSMVALRYLNLCSLFFGGRYFAEYRNFPLFGYAVNTQSIGAAVILVLLLLSFGIAAKSSGAFSRSASGRKKKASGRFSAKPVGPVRYELRKSFVTSRGWVLLVLLLAVQIAVLSSRNLYINQTEYFYNFYSAVVDGDLSAANKALLEDALYEERHAAERVQELNEAFARGEITAEELISMMESIHPSASREEALTKAVEQYAQLEEMQRTGKKVSYINQLGYEKILGGRHLDLCIMIVLSAVLFSFYGSIDYESGVAQLICASGYGARKSRKGRLFSAGLYAVLFTLLTLVPAALQVISKYPLSGLDRPVTSILALSWFPVECSAALGLCIVVLACILLVFAEAILLLKIAALCKNRLQTMLAGGVLGFLTVLGIWMI